MKSTLLFCISLLMAAVNCGIIEAQDTNSKEIIPDTTQFFNGIWIGADLLGPIARVTNNAYSSYELSLEGGFKNKYYPIIEVGMAKGSTVAVDGSSFEGVSSPYGKVGLNYAIIRSESGFFYLGYRFGYSKFSYSISNLSLTSNYWGESYKTNLLNENSWATWHEYVLGLRVNIVSRLYMGWNVRYNTLSKTKTMQYSQPAYIPGFGKNGTSDYGIHFNVYYKF